MKGAVTTTSAAMDRAGALRLVADNAALLDTAGQSNPYLLSAWTEHFLRQIAADDWRIHAPRAADGSLMLLYGTAEAPRRLHSLVNYYSSLWAPALADPAQAAGAVDEIVDQLTRLRPRPASLQLSPLSAEHPSTAALVSALQARGWFVSRYFCFGNWYMDCEGLSFDTYMSQRESRLVNTWKRKAKKLAGGPGAPTRVEIITTPEQVDAAVAAYESIYAKSWKQPEPYPNFVGDWARTCARQGWLRMGLAWVDGVPVAAQLWFTVARRAYIFKLAYDEAYASWSAGTVLSAELFRHSLDVDHVVEIDYLTGDDAYKRSWMSQRRERVGLLACNLRTAAGVMLAGREWLGALRKRSRAAEPVVATQPAET